MKYGFHSRVYTLVVLLFVTLFTTVGFAQATSDHHSIAKKHHSAKVAANKNHFKIEPPVIVIPADTPNKQSAPVVAADTTNKHENKHKTFQQLVQADTKKMLFPTAKLELENTDATIKPVLQIAKNDVKARNVNPILKTETNTTPGKITKPASQIIKVSTKTKTVNPIVKAETSKKQEKITKPAPQIVKVNTKIQTVNPMVKAETSKKQEKIIKPVPQIAKANTKTQSFNPLVKADTSKLEKIIKPAFQVAKNDSKIKPLTAIDKPQNTDKIERITKSVSHEVKMNINTQALSPAVTPETIKKHKKIKSQHVAQIIKSPTTYKHSIATKHVHHVVRANNTAFDTIAKPETKTDESANDPILQLAQTDTPIQSDVPVAKPATPSKPYMPTAQPDTTISQPNTQTIKQTTSIKETSGQAKPSTEVTATNGRKLWNLKDVDIRTFVRTVSEETGKNFVIDPRVTGKVTFISAQPLNLDELYQAFLSVLQVNGFVALPDHKVIKIVPDYIAKGLSSPIYTERKTGDAMAVTVVPVRFVPANELSGVLNQFVTPSGHIAAYAPSNHLIVADRAGNISNLLRLIKDIDQQRSGKIELVHLHNASAKQLVETLKSILERKSTSPGLFSAMADVTLAADERTNSILIGGGSVEQRKQVRVIIQQLDTSNNAPTSTTEVIYLKHLHAERVATIVNGIIQNYFGKTEKMQTSTTTTTTEGGGTSSNQSATSSLFNTGLAGSSTQAGQTNTMYSSSGGFYTANSPNNDINNIVEKLPKSGSLSPYVQWEESTNSLVVTAPHDLMRKIKVVIDKLDIRRPQVLIEAVIAEVSEERQKELGIQWNPSGTVSFQTSFLPTLPLSMIGVDGKLATLQGGKDTVGQGLSLTFNGNQIRFLIAALETDSTSNVLATPNLVTLDNEPAQIKVGAKVPFATAQIQNNPTGGNPFNFFNREDVGLVLTIAPQIAPNGAIKLLIQQELSAILPGAGGVAGNPTTSERFIRTTVMADNGQILVLGGLLQNQWDTTVDRVPWLGNLPLVGALFRDKNKRINKTNLMIFLRPTIMYDRFDEERISGGKYEFLRQTQLKVDRHNPFYHHYETPVLPKEIELPPPFIDQYPVYVGEG